MAEITDQHLLFLSQSTQTVFGASTNASVQAITRYNNIAEAVHNKQVESVIDSSSSFGEQINNGIAAAAGIRFATPPALTVPATPV